MTRGFIAVVIAASLQQANVALDRFAYAITTKGYSRGESLQALVSDQHEAANIRVADLGVRSRSLELHSLQSRR